MNDQDLSDIAWINAALFDGHGFSSAGRGAYLAMPRRSACRRIVVRDPRFGAASFQKRHDAMGSTRRAAATMARLGFRAGFGQLLMSNALDLDEAFGLAGDPDRSLLAALGRSVPAAHRFAVTLGPRRTNRKPVVELFDRSARPVAYAKVACDDLTAGLVGNEASWLARATPVGPFAAPGVLAELDWRGRPVLVVAAVDSAASTRRGGLSRGRLGDLQSHIADLGQRSTMTVEALCRVLASSADPDSATQRLVDGLDPQIAARSVPVGAWHGDLTPWNTISDMTRTWVLDWEFASEPMAVGADLVHHDVMVAVHLDGSRPEAALRSAEQRSVPEVFVPYLVALAARHATQLRLGAAPDPLALAASRRLAGLG